MISDAINPREVVNRRARRAGKVTPGPVDPTTVSGVSSAQYLCVSDPTALADDTFLRVDFGELVHFSGYHRAGISAPCSVPTSLTSLDSQQVQDLVERLTAWLNKQPRWVLIQARGDRLTSDVIRVASRVIYLSQEEALKALNELPAVPGVAVCAVQVPLDMAMKMTAAPAEAIRAPEPPQPPRRT